MTSWSRALVVVCALAMMGVLQAEAQQARISRIGYLRLIEGSAYDDAFRKGLRDLGYVDGQKYRLPVMFDTRDFVEAGGLISYGTDLTDLYHRAAAYVDKILKGASPATLPVEQATKFELFINLKAAKQIGLTIPRSVLLRADRVVE